MLTRGDNDPQLRTGINVDVRINAALTDEPQPAESMHERRANRGPLPYQHQGFGAPQPFGQEVDVMNVIVPDFDLVAR